MDKNIISLKNNSNLILFSILFLSLIIRILALLSLKNTVYFDYLLWDERVYHTWAENLARGILLRVDKKRALREYKNLVYISSFYDI